MGYQFRPPNRAPHPVRVTTGHPVGHDTERVIIAYDYPLLGVFWTMLLFFLWFAWLMLLFYVFIDIFRSHDLSGVLKALWLIFVIVLPFLGLFVYLLARGNKMAEHRAADAVAQDAAFKSYVQADGRYERPRRSAHAAGGAP